MLYTVVWTPAAEQQLAAIWLGAVDRQAVTRASYLIEYRLRFIPLQLGYPTGSGRAVVVPPLIARYEVSPDDCMVRIVGVIETA